MHPLKEMIPRDQVRDHRLRALAQRRRQIVVVQDLRQRPAAHHLGQVPLVQVSQRRLEPRDGIHVEEPGQGRMPVNEPARPDRADHRQRLDVSLGRPFGEERRAHVRHERVADEEQSLAGKMDEQRILRFTAADGDEPQIEGSEAQGFLRGDETVGAHVQPDRPVAEEPVERPLRAAHPRQLLGEVRPGNDDRAGLADRGEAADMVPVRVCQDDVTDRRVGDLAQRLHRRPGAVFRGAGIDGDDARRIHQEADVGEIEAFCDVHSVGFPDELRIREPESRVRADRDVSRDRGSVWGVIPGAPQHLPRASLVAERPPGIRKRAEHPSIDLDREVVASGERRLQIRDRLPCLAEPLRQVGEDESPQELPGDRLGFGAPVQLANRLFDPGHAPQERNLAGAARLQQTFQGGEHRAVRLLTGEPLEVLVSVPLVPRGHELLGGDDGDRHLSVRPGGGCGEAFHFAVLRKLRRGPRNRGARRSDESDGDESRG